MKGLILTAGNILNGDDAAGPLLARRLAASPLPGWEVIDGGTVPENHLYRIRELHPGLVVVVDAAEMGLPPGSIRFLLEPDIAGQMLMTTHNIPLSYLIRAIREMGCQVLFLGIQPGLVAFGHPPTREVKRAVATVYDRLREGRLDFPRFKPDHA